MNIILNKVQTNKMLKAKGLLEDMFDNGKSHGLTPYCMRDMASCYNEIVKSVEHYGMTMCEEVANLFNASTASFSVSYNHNSVSPASPTQ